MPPTKHCTLDRSVSGTAHSSLRLCVSKGRNSTPFTVEILRRP